MAHVNMNAVGIGRFSGHSGSNAFVGINESGLVNIKSLIQEMVKRAQGILDGMVTNISQENAFKGEELQKAMTKFVTAVKTEGAEWISNINKYCDVIDTILEGMKTTQSQMVSNLDESSSAVSSQTELYNYGGGSSSAS